MDNNLYFLSNGKAVMIAERNYDQEDDLQSILANNPNLLLRSAEIGTNNLFLITRELNIYEGADSSNSYSLDILLVDQAGIPVLVEVKRSSDTRIRREVVGQMLDYASRASEWSTDILREYFRSNNTEIARSRYDTGDFWSQVSNNLQSENLRLVFAADCIPDTLKKLIDFLDRNMPGIEVYGAEIRQFIADSITILSSTIVGSDAAHLQNDSRNIEWSSDSFSQYLHDHNCDRTLTIAQELQSYATEIGLLCSFGRGVKYPAFTAKKNDTTIFKVVSWDNQKSGFRVVVEIGIPALTAHLKPEWSEADLRNLLSQISPVGEWSVKEHPQVLYIDLELLYDENNMAIFKDAVSKISTAIFSSDESQS